MRIIYSVYFLAMISIVFITIGCSRPFVPARITVLSSKKYLLDGSDVGGLYHLKDQLKETVSMKGYSTVILEFEEYIHTDNFIYLVRQVVPVGILKYQMVPLPLHVALGTEIWLVEGNSAPPYLSVTITRDGFQTQNEPIEKEQLFQRVALVQREGGRILIRLQNDAIMADVVQFLQICQNANIPFVVLLMGESSGVEVSPEISKSRSR